MHINGENRKGSSGLKGLASRDVSDLLQRADTSLVLRLFPLAENSPKRPGSFWSVSSCLIFTQQGVFFLGNMGGSSGVTPGRPPKVIFVQ